MFVNQRETTGTNSRKHVYGLGKLIGVRTFV